MRDLTLPRERLDARIGWQEALATDRLVVQDDRLHLAATTRDADGQQHFAQAIPNTDLRGSFGGRTLPRGLAISAQGDVYLADAAGARILYTRASHAPLPDDPNDPYAPFVPFFQFAQTPEPGHPLALTGPVDLALVPAGADVGQFADTLVIADGARLIWMDRHHGYARHVLALGRAIVAIAVDAAGNVHAVLAATDTAAQALVTLRRGAVSRQVDLTRAAHALAVMADGVALLAGPQDVWAIGLDGREAAAAPYLDSGALTPRALQKQGDTLLYHDGCENRDPLVLEGLATDRYGNIGAPGLALVTLPQKLPRPRQGSWIAGPFDGDRRAFPWHRIALDAQVPAQCRLVISTYCVEHELDVAQVQALDDWQGRAVIDPGDPAESLVQRNAGRYLWLRIEAFGNGVDTASITGIDIFGPRDSQINLLPAPFHQDPESADFLDRLLSLQDMFLAEALNTFNSVGAILRPAATPTEFLSWLGGWFDWTFLAEWDDSTRREMIATSMRFFDERGTICGLMRMLRWHTGLTSGLPVVLEGYRSQRAAEQAIAAGQGGAVWLAGAQVDLAQNGTHHFTVVLPEGAAEDQTARDQIDRIIAAQKPAHTTHSVVYVRPGFVPGQQAMLGIDAILGDTRPPPLGQAALGTELQTIDPC